MGWFKFWSSALHNPKIAQLSNEEFRVLICIWCLASESSERGVIKSASIEAIGQISGANNPDLGSSSGLDMKRVIERLVASRLVTLRHAEGVTVDVTVCDWDEWQGVTHRHASAERSRRYRIRCKGLQERDASVASRVTQPLRHAQRKRERKIERKKENASAYADTAAPPPRLPMKIPRAKKEDPAIRDAIAFREACHQEQDRLGVPRVPFQNALFGRIVEAARESSGANWPQRGTNAARSLHNNPKLRLHQMLGGKNYAMILEGLESGPWGNGDGKGPKPTGVEAWLEEKS